MKRLGWFLLVCALVAGGSTVLHKKPQQPRLRPQIQALPQVEPAPPVKPRTPNVSVPMPDYLPYDKLTQQLDRWHGEAPDLTERGTYGQTGSGQPIHYLRVTNLLNKSPKKAAMITGCIHGNEPLSTATVMAWVGGLLSQYGKNNAVTELLDTVDVYFVPVVSPDSYPNSRFANGVDPNRNFPCPARPNVRSVPPIKSVQDFFLKIKPQVAISCHTSGRMCLVPWGDSNAVCPDNESYRLVVGRVCNMTGYSYLRACELYRRPIYGGEMDWYYRNGAFSVVMEMGSHQNIPSPRDISTEYNKTFKGMLYLVQEGSKVRLKNERPADR